MRAVSRLLLTGLPVRLRPPKKQNDGLLRPGQAGDGLDQEFQEVCRVVKLLRHELLVFRNLSDGSREKPVSPFHHGVE